MIRVFKTSAEYGNEYKVSINFRTNVIRVWEKSFHTGKWYKCFISSYLTDREIIDVAYTMKPDEFRKFIVEDNRNSLWR